MSVAGTFYPAECSTVKRYIDTFTQALPAQNYKRQVRAIIAPHAGYVYSGFTANAAYSQVDTKTIKRVVLIGPSHRVYLKGASVALHETYESPCASIKIDQEYSKVLLQQHAVLSTVQTAHAEHSTETQVPFIEHYFDDVQLVEIVYGDICYTDLTPVVDEILATEENFVVISTDLSHFYDLDKANKLDAICYEGIKKMDVNSLSQGCEACGMIGIKALIEAAQKRGLESEVIDYRTSYDASGDASSVVGYLSVLIG